LDKKRMEITDTLCFGMIYRLRPFERGIVITHDAQVERVLVDLEGEAILHSHAGFPDVSCALDPFRPQAGVEGLASFLGREEANRLVDPFLHLCRQVSVPLGEGG